MILPYRRRILKRIVLGALICLTIGVYFLTLRENALSADTYFHLGRIKELRYAFAHLELPNFLNFQSFFGMGQAVNAMYPDITLWPFVLLTMGFTPAHQVVAIKLLIFILTLMVSYYCLCRRAIPSDISLYSAIVLTFFAGNMEIANMFTPGTSIIGIFLLPIAFTIKDILSSRQFDKRLIIKFGLIIILITYSHLLTIVILAFIMFGILVMNIITGRFSIYAIVNVVVGGVIGLMGSAPIIYRYLLFSKNGIVMPYRLGNITTLFKFPYISKVYLLSIVIACSLPCLYLQKAKAKSCYWHLLIIEAYIYLLCSSFFPWRLFNNVPVVNCLQFSNRFQTYLCVIPVIILAQFTKKHYKLGISVAFLLIIIWLGQATQNYISYTGPVITDRSYESVGRVTGNLSKEDLRINAPAGKPMYYYDYYPSSMPNTYRTTWQMSAQGRKTILDQQIKGSDDAVRINKQSINNGIQIKPKQDVYSDRSLILPVLGYRGLKYQTFVNGHRVGNHLDKMNLAIDAHTLKRSDKVVVIFKNPPIYSWIVVAALMYDLLLLVYLKFTSSKTLLLEGKDY